MTGQESVKQISCPVFRCAKTSISQCTGYPKPCDRYYCTRHTVGTLCDRCAQRSQARKTEHHPQLIKDVSRHSLSESLSAGILLLSIVSILSMVLGFIFYSYGVIGGNTPILFLLIVGGGAGVCVSIFWFQMKARSYGHNKALELEEQNPGFSASYKRQEDIIKSIGSEHN